MYLLSQAPESILAVEHLTHRKRAGSPRWELSREASRSHGINSTPLSATLTRRSGPPLSSGKANGHDPEKCRHMPFGNHSAAACTTERTLALLVRWRLDTLPTADCACLK